MRTRSLGPAVAAVVVAAGAGCNSILGIGDLHVAGNADAGADAAADAMPMSACGALAPPDTVVGCAVVTHVRADGTTFVTPKDMSGYTVAAYVPDQSASGFSIISGTGHPDGTVRVDGVPDGTAFFLRLQDPNEAQYAWPDFYYADKHDLDLGYVELGRDDTPATADTEVTVAMTGMSPWKTGDAIDVDSFNAGLVNTFDASGLTVAATGATLTSDWRLGREEATFSDLVDSASRLAQLVDQGAGHADDLWVLHLRNAPVTGAGYHPTLTGTIVDAFQPTGVTMTDGAPITISGAFQATPAVPTPLNVTVNLGQARAAIHDDGHYVSENLSCILTTNPGADRGLFAEGIVTLSRDLYPTDTMVTLSATYTNPFPASWPKNLQCLLAHIRVRQSSTWFFDFGESYVGSIMPFTASDLTWTPLVHTVANLKIDGIDAIADGTVPFDGASPVTMSWDQVPGANHYAVRIKDASTRAFVGKVDTWEASVTLPADLFTKGDLYVFRVFAVQSPTDYHAGQLLAFDEPLWTTRQATGVLRFSNLCGNGNVDPGEDCDPGPSGNSPSCNADCTAVACGDGFVNPAAGEACDDSDDSAHCNSDCTAVACGDGKWDPAAGEECDDGNATDGDGCSQLCRLERCGDGTVDPGEGCDDGNRVDGDGCSALCQP